LHNLWFWNIRVYCLLCLGVRRDMLCVRHLHVWQLHFFGVHVNVEHRVQCLLVVQFWPVRLYGLHSHWHNQHSVLFLQLQLRFLHRQCILFMLDLQQRLLQGCDQLPSLFNLRLWHLPNRSLRYQHRHRLHCMQFQLRHLHRL
jgi:hypothetical protein